MKVTEGSKTPHKHEADLYQNSQLTREATDVKWTTKRWHCTWVEVKFMWASHVTLHMCAVCTNYCYSWVRISTEVLCDTTEIYPHNI